MDDVTLDRALVFAAELEAAARAVYERGAHAHERKIADEVKRNANGLRIAVGRWIQLRVEQGQHVAS